MGVKREPLNLEELLRNFYLLLRNSNQVWNKPLDVLLHIPSPKSSPQSQLFPCLDGMQLNQRATCALRWPKQLSDSLYVWENGQDQMRNTWVPLRRGIIGRIRRPKKGATILAHWEAALPCPSPPLPHMGQSHLLGEAQPGAVAPSKPGEKKISFYCWRQALSPSRVMEQGQTGPFQDMSALCPLG